MSYEESDKKCVTNKRVFHPIHVSEQHVSHFFVIVIQIRGKYFVSGLVEEHGHFYCVSRGSSLLSFVAVQHVVLLLR